MDLNYPTFTTGFALNKHESAYPFLWDGLAGIWCPELGKQGDRLYDFSGYGHTSTLNGLSFSGATSNWVPGRYGYAIDYDGTNDNATTGNIPQINSVAQTMTIMFWVRTTQGAGNFCLCSYDNNDSLSPSLDWYVYHPENLTIGGFCDGNERSSGVAVNDGKWHHVAIVARKTSVEVWLDGILKSNTTGLTQKGTDYTTSHTLRFADNSNVSFFAGSIGEFRLYSRDLQGSEIRQSYLGASPLTLSPLFIHGLRETTIIDYQDSDTLTLSDSLDVNERTFTSSETLILTDSLEASDTSPQFSETLTLSDILSADVRTLTDSENLTVSDSLQVDIVDENTSTSYGVRILSINPLLFISLVPEIVKVDTTDPENPTWDVQAIVGITTVYDAYINDTNEFIYVAADAGKVVKIEIADLSNQTIFDVSDSSNISTIDGLPLFGLTFAGTDQSTGEMYVIDERNTFKVDSDFQFITDHLLKINSDFRLINAFKMNSEFTFLSYNKFFIRTDFKFLSDPVSDIEPIRQRDFRIYIDNVEVIDPDLSLDSISLTHTIDQESVVTFKLNRRHDDLNHNLDGDLIVINAQNDVRLEIDGRVEFDGKITDLDCQYNQTSEQILVTASQVQPDYQFNNVTVPLSSLDKRLGLYDVLIQNPKISNPFIDDRIIILSDLDEYWTNAGTWSTSLNDVKVFSTFQEAADYITATKLTNPTFASKNPRVGSPVKNPKKYMGVVANLGQLKQQNHLNYYFSDPFGSIADSIQNGTFIPKQNWTYFWGAFVIKPSFFASITTPNNSQFFSTQVPSVDSDTSTTAFEKIKLPVFKLPTFQWPGSVNATGQTTGIYFQYIGTSLSPISSDIWSLKNAPHHYQRIYPDTITELGYYSVGSAPFKEVNPKNGRLNPMWFYTDESDGLYFNIDESYDYTNFVKKVVDLEYEKLKNINGDILPEARCSLSLSIDAYYFYGLKLLTRINIDNTFEPNTYKDNNGFPVSIKSITITSSDMLVSLQTDNLMSVIEQNELNNQFPDDADYTFPGKHKLIDTKSDMRTGLAVE